MPRRFRLLIEGSGLAVREKGLGVVRGFYAIRRTVADTPEEAEHKAIAALRAEEQFQRLVEMTERELGNRHRCELRVDSIGELSWLGWHFSRFRGWKSFVFHGDRDGPSNDGP